MNTELNRTESTRTDVLSFLATLGYSTVITNGNVSEIRKA